jgi:uncharacterized protein (TIGR02271 family)
MTMIEIGVLDNPTIADRAVAALNAAGFRRDHIYVSGQHPSGGFMSGVKKIFTGEEGTSDQDVVNDLSAMGLSRNEAQYYKQEYDAGHVIIAVQESGREQEAAYILSENGASTYTAQQTTGQATRSADPNIASSQQAATASNTTATDEVRSRRPSNIPDETRSRNIPLREEQLRAEKHRVQAGEVELHKDVITEQQSFDVPVMHEEVYIERRPVTEGSVEDHTPIGQDETIRIPLSAEQVNVSKETNVTGEVSVEKRAVEETQRVSDTVRQEELHVEKEGEIQRRGEGRNRGRIPPQQPNEQQP